MSAVTSSTTGIHNRLLRLSSRSFDDDDVRAALEQHRKQLELSGTPLWHVSQPTLFAEALYRLDY